VCPRVEAPTEDPAAELQKEGGTSLPTGGAARRLLDFLSTTDVGRLASAEDDAGSEVSEWGRWEREEELGVAEELAADEGPLFLPTPSFMASAEED